MIREMIVLIPMNREFRFYILVNCAQAPPVSNFNFNFNLLNKYLQNIYTIHEPTNSTANRGKLMFTN